MMFKDMLSKNKSIREAVSPTEEILICGLILGELVDPARPWLSEIVSNARNGIDVDKFDYLRRDA